VSQLIDEKYPKISFTMMGELCMEAGNTVLAIKAIRREKRPEIKIDALIEIEAWKDAVEDIFANRKHPEFENWI